MHDIHSVINITFDAPTISIGWLVLKVLGVIVRKGFKALLKSRRSITNPPSLIIGKSRWD